MACVSGISKTVAGSLDQPQKNIIQLQHISLNGGQKLGWRNDLPFLRLCCFQFCDHVRNEYD